jgi:hypothetical protein
MTAAPKTSAPVSPPLDLPGVVQLHPPAGVPFVAAGATHLPSGVQDAG